MANDFSKFSKGDLEKRIYELEAQIQRFTLFPEKLASFSEGSCTNNCTAACTIGCTSGCTGGCVTNPDLQITSFDKLRAG